MDRTIQKNFAVYFFSLRFIGLKTFNVGGLDDNQSKSVSVNVSSSRMTYGRFRISRNGLGKTSRFTTTVEMLLFKPLVQSLKSTSVNPSGNTYGCFTTYPKLKEYNINLMLIQLHEKYFITTASNLLLPVFLSEV
jgi:hypothetical protein